MSQTLENRPDTKPIENNEGKLLAGNVLIACKNTVREIYRELRSNMPLKFEQKYAKKKTHYQNR